MIKENTLYEIRITEEADSYVSAIALVDEPAIEKDFLAFEKYRKETVKAKSIWTETKYISEQGTTELGRLGLASKFEFPKPVDLIVDCLELCANDEAIVLDSFGGSGTRFSLISVRKVIAFGARGNVLMTWEQTSAWVARSGTTSAM